MKIIECLKLLVEGSTAKIWRAGEDAWWRLTVLISVVILLPFALYATGFALAAYGETADLVGVWQNWTAFWVYGMVPAILLIAVPFLYRAAVRASRPWLERNGVVDPVPAEAATEDELDAAEAAEEAAQEAGRKASPIPALVLLALVAGVIAESVVRHGAILAGQGIMMVSGVVAAVAMLLLLLRVTVIGAVVLMVRGLVPHSFVTWPEVPSESMKAVGRQIAGAMAVAMFLIVIFHGLPVWRTPGYFLAALCAFALLVFAAAANWLDGVIVKRVLPVFATVRFLLLIAVMASPQLEASLKEASNKHLGTPADRADVELLSAFRQERETIRLRMARLCGGQYCTEITENGVTREVDDASRIKVLDRNIALLLHGEYQQSLDGNGAVSAGTQFLPAPPAPDAPAPPQLQPFYGSNHGNADDRDDVTDLPPPPAAPVGHVAPAVTPQPAAERQSEFAYGTRGHRTIGTSPTRKRQALALSDI